MTEKINQIIKQLKGKNKDKKLVDIEQYINDTHTGVNCTLTKPEDLLNLSVQIDDDDIEFITEIINQSYSCNFPHYLFKLESTGASINDLLQMLLQNLSGQSLISISDDVDLYSCKLIEDSGNGNFKLQIYYRSFLTIRTLNGSQRKGEIRRGYIYCNFLFDKNILIINTGDETLARRIYDYLSRNYYTHLRIEPFLINTASVKYNGPIDADSVTVFMLELITNTLADTTHIIQDYKKIGFDNPRGQRIKTIRLGGTDLLNSDEVAEQIKNGLHLKSVELGMLWCINNQAAITSNISIQIKSSLKITISKLDNLNYMLDLVLYVYDKINSLICNGVTLGIATDILNHYFSQVMGRHRTQRYALIQEIREKLKSCSVLTPYSKNIDEVLQEFRR